MKIKLFLVVIAIGLLALAHFAGILDTFRDPQYLKEFLLDAGPWGYFLFLASFFFLQPAGMPGFIFVIAASLVWPKPVAFVLSMIGSIGGAIGGFMFARYIARDWVKRHLPDRFHRFDRRLSEHGFTTVIMIYLIFFLAPPTHWILGLSRVKFTAFLLGACFGLLPGVATLTFVGGAFMEWLSRQSIWVWFAAGTVVAALFLSRRLTQEREISK